MQSDGVPSIDRPESPVQSAVAPRAPLLPDSVRNPLNLLWIWVLPQTFLLLMNLRSFVVIWGEMDADQKVQGRSILGAEIFMLLIGAGLAIGLRAARKPLAWVLNWPLLVLPVGYLWLIVVSGLKMIPNSVSAWILPPETFLYYQFAFMMPAAFYAAMLLSCFKTRSPVAVDIGVSLGVVVGVPVAWFAGIYLIGWLERSFGSGSLYVWALIVSFVCATIMAVAALLRLTVITYIAVRKTGPVALGIFTAVVAVAGPIGGLLLNRKIPFPVDLQSADIYAMVALNGVLLLLPNFRHIRLHRAVWLAQCAMFPFTFYFFVVFLPFLPLAVIAMIAAGAGFLVLVPTALFLLHGQRLLDGFRSEVRGGGRLVPALLGALAVALMPVYYTARALSDRHVLRAAVDYAYAPDFRNAGKFPGSTAALKRGLDHLRDLKTGLQLPFLSDYYNWLVFDGLVLPDEKMTHLHTLFFGSDFEESTRKGGGVFAMRGERRSVIETRAARLVPNNVLLKEITPASENDEGCVRTRATLTLQNLGTAESEFVTQIHLPDGVLVSGFWLRIGTEQVPGRIFEKKTAQWVYQKIRDVSRRDPGLLLFTAPGSLELRVFPFAGNETRTVEIEFLSAMPAEIEIGGRTVHAGPRVENDSPVLARHGDGSSALVVTPAQLAKLPAIKRVPYLHFIVDCSANSTVAPDTLKQTMQTVAQKFPDARDCFISAANYESADVTKQLIPISTLDGLDEKQLLTLPRRGGFAEDRAIKRTLLATSDRLVGADANSPQMRTFPIIVVIRGSDVAPVNEDGLESFGKLVPDTGGFCTTTNGIALAWHGWSNAALSDGAASSTHQVVILKNGKSVVAADANPKAPVMLCFQNSDDNARIEVLDFLKPAFKPLDGVTKLARDSRYVLGVSAWLQQLAVVFNPSLEAIDLARVVSASRAAGVLVPATSYIVVENSAQWRTLEEKEKQKLGTSGALAFEETPEPSTWILMAVGGGILLVLARRRSARV